MDDERYVKLANKYVARLRELREAQRRCHELARRNEQREAENERLKRERVRP